MARSKKTAAEQKDIRLRKKFGIDLAEHDRRRAEQNDKCGICGGPLDAYGPPCVDHYHFHVEVSRHDPTPQDATKWCAEAYNELGKTMAICHSITRKQAIADAKRYAMPKSVRGLLCFKCSRALDYVERFFGAARNPDILNNVANYLRARLNNA